jgi:hypothetical protein
MRVPRRTPAPLTLPGMLSTVGHWDQSSATVEPLPFILTRSARVAQTRLRGPAAFLSDSRGFIGGRLRSINHGQLSLIDKFDISPYTYFIGELDESPTEVCPGARTMALPQSSNLSTARLAANRRNALKSTGPKTPAGKRRVALNKGRDKELCSPGTGAGTPGAGREPSGLPPDGPRSDRDFPARRHF